MAKTKKSSESPLVQLRTMLKADDQWKKFRNIVREAYKPEFDKFLDELSDLHKSRTTRQLSADGYPTGKKVARAASKEMAVRSRAVEICMEIARNRNWLYISMSTMQKRIETENYSWFISVGVRGVNDRKSLCQSVMSGAQKALDQLDTITEIADLVIADVDQSSYSLKHLTDAMAVATARERG